jgi:hypothetical protein
VTLVPSKTPKRIVREPNHLPHGRQTGSLKIVKHIEQLIVILQRLET